MPGYASTSIPRWTRLPARSTKNPVNMGIVITEAGITPKRDASQIPAAARADITPAPGILWATPPWVNRYRAGDLSDSIIKNISASRMTAPMTAKGRRDEGLPKARKSVAVTRA